MNRAQAVGLQAQRAADTALGATLSAGESIGESTKRFRKPGPEFSRIRDRLTTEARKAERRGAQARKRAQRELKQRRNEALRAVRGQRREAEQRVEDTRREAEERFSSVQSKAEDLIGRANEQTRTVA
jgi:hypothetical protein